MAKVIKILVIMIAIFTTFVGTVCFLVLSKSDETNHQAESSSKLLEKAVESAIKGNQAEITNQELNGFLSYIIEQNGRELDVSDDIKVKSLYTELANEEDKADVYANISYKGVEINSTMSTSVHFDEANNTLDIIIHKLKLGKLVVSPKLLLSVIANQVKPPSTTHGNTISINLSQETSFYQGPYIKYFKIKDSKAYLQVTPLSEVAQEFAQERLKQGKNVLDNIIDNVADYYNQNLKPFFIN